MRSTLAVMVLAGLFAGAWAEDENPVAPSKVVPENDWRLARRTGSRSKTIGIFEFYPNKGGGYTFTRDGEIEFYALPNRPAAYHQSATVLEVKSDANGRITTSSVIELRTLSTIGMKPMLAGGQTVYRYEMTATYPGVFVRNDIPIATWSRDAPGAKFTLSRWCEDGETRLKLKSIIPVLEQAEH